MGPIVDAVSRAIRNGEIDPVYRNSEGIAYKAAWERMTEAHWHFTTPEGIITAERLMADAARDHDKMLTHMIARAAGARLVSLVGPIVVQSVGRAP